MKQHNVQKTWSLFNAIANSNALQNISIQIYLGQLLDHSGLRDVSGHVTIWYPICQDALDLAGLFFPPPRIPNRPESYRKSFGRWDRPMPIGIQFRSLRTNQPKQHIELWR